MRTVSVWEVECLCGELIITTVPVARCLSCRRAIEIQWQAALSDADSPPRQLSDNTNLERNPDAQTKA